MTAEQTTFVISRLLIIEVREFLYTVKCGCAKPFFIGFFFGGRLCLLDVVEVGVGVIPIIQRSVSEGCHGIAVLFDVAFITVFVNDTVYGKACVIRATIQIGNEDKLIKKLSEQNNELELLRKEIVVLRQLKGSKRKCKKGHR